MSKWLTVTNSDGDKYYVNMENVIQVRKCYGQPKYKSVIEYVSAEHSYAVETPEEIVAGEQGYQGELEI